MAASEDFVTLEVKDPEIKDSDFSPGDSKSRGEEHHIDITTPLLSDEKNKQSEEIQVLTTPSPGRLERIKTACKAASAYAFGRCTKIHGLIFLKKMQTISVDLLAIGGVAGLYVYYDPPLSLAFVSSPIVGAAIGPRVPKIFRSLSFFVPEILLTENSKIIRRAEECLEALYSIKRKNSDKEKEKIISKIIKQLENALAQCDGFADIMGSVPPWLHEMIHEQMPLYINYPVKSLGQIHSSLSEKESKQERDRMTKEFNTKCLTPFDVKTRAELERHCLSIQNRILPLQGYHFKYRLNPVELNGPPGVGKTHLVQQLAKIYKIPIVIISFGEKKLEQFAGQKPMNPNLSPTPSLILKAITDATNNPHKVDDLIVFIDEIDKVISKKDKQDAVSTQKRDELISFLLRFLDGNTKIWEDEGLDVPVGLENFTIFFGTNDKCFMSIESLQDRMKTIDMPKLNEAGKQHILTEKLNEEILSKIYPETTDNKRLVELRKSVASFLMHTKIKEIAGTDKAEGARGAIRAMIDSFFNPMRYDIEVKSRQSYKKYDSTHILGELGVKTCYKESTKIKNWKEVYSVQDLIEIIVYLTGDFDHVPLPFSSNAPEASFLPRFSEVTAADPKPKRKEVVSLSLIPDASDTPKQDILKPH